MSIPKITRATPLTQPAREEKTFPDVFVSQILIQAEPGGKVSADIRHRAYDHATKELGPEESADRIRIADVDAFAGEQASAGNTKLADAVGALSTAIEDIVNNQS